MSTAEEDLRFSFLYKTLLNRFNIFKTQDLETGYFDVVFQVEGKKLYGHKFMLTSVSTTLDSWLSDRWSTKDEIIKIESYSFDSFYLFLCFIYSGSCELTAENVREIVDISEFYAVPYLKELCDIFLSKMENFITLENAEEMFDFSQKYSLPQFLGAIKKFTSHHTIIVRQFITYKKSFVQFLLSDKNLIDIYVPLFEKVYHWAENQIINSEGAEHENFNLLEAVKAKVYEILPNNFSTCHMYYEFLRDFYIEKGFALSPAQFYEFYQQDQYSYSREKRLRWVCFQTHMGMTRDY
uniref:BTB domain-containing protein n=1 Tax=Panagrolaimus davidi TaxID=227884 RepID=A0A914QG64_9BILA